MCGFPPISCHKENAWDGQLNSDTKAFSVMYAGYDAARGCDDLVLLAGQSLVGGGLAFRSRPAGGIRLADGRLHRSGGGRGDLSGGKVLDR